MVTSAVIFCVANSITCRRTTNERPPENCRNLGVIWCQPWHVNVSGVSKDGENIPEVEVVNLWPDSLIEDDSLPEEERRTRTNVISYRKDDPLMPSGLLGPVRLKMANFDNSDGCFKFRFRPEDFFI